MSNELAKKLLLHKAKRILILNQPDGYIDSLKSELPDNVEFFTEPTGDVDLVHLFVKDSEELKQWLGVTLRSVQHDGLIWVSYPKKSSKMKSDLNRDILVSLLHEVGHEGVSLISIDDTWSAMRVRPIKDK
jgi:hypothetical protein